MSLTEQLTSRTFWGSPRHSLFRRPGASFRTKILVPLLFLMALSTLATVVMFTISTHNTRNQILDAQLTEDMRRLAAALALSEDEVRDSARLLAGDPELAQALHLDTSLQGSATVLDLDRRALPIRDRFRLDQVMVLNAQRQARVNIVTRSSLSQMPMFDQAYLDRCSASVQILLVNATMRDDSAILLMGCAPVWHAPVPDQSGTLLGTTHTILDLTETLPRMQRELGLLSEIQLSAGNLVVSTLPQPVAVPPESSTVQAGSESYRPFSLAFVLGGHDVQITLLRSKTDLNAVVGSGFRAMIVSSIITMLLLVGMGILLARRLTRPILDLSEVARAVAAGDLSRRANLIEQDEVGQLGRAFDRATETITDLLDEQARTAGKFHAILQSIADGVLAVDIAERIVLINPAAASLLEHEPEMLLGQPLTALLDVDDPIRVTGLQQVVDQLASELVDPDLMPTEERVTLGKRVVRLQSAPTRGSAGVLTGAVVVIQDVTRAVEADRLKGEFIATASHELRTPLTGIKGFIALFHLDGLSNLTENQRLGLETITRQTDHLVSLVNDVLETARFDRGVLRAERRWVNLVNTLDEALISLQTLIAARHVSLTLNLAPELAPIWIDHLHLRRILTNLLSNAIKYVHPGRGTVHVRAYALHDPALLPSPPRAQTWLHKDEHSIVVEIADNGVGIKAEDQPRIFQRFFRSDNVLSAEVGGTGLGLAITYSLVQFHGGQIGFRSTEGQGSCFWVRLPVSNTEPIQMPASVLPRRLLSGSRDTSLPSDRQAHGSGEEGSSEGRALA